MSILQNLIRHTRLLEIVGDLIRVRAQGVAFGDLAMIENIDGERSLAKVVDLDRDIVSLQVFAGGKGLSTDAKVNFLGRPLNVVYSDNILGRIFRGSGDPIDGGPELPTDPRIPVDGPTVNPVMRVMPSRMIETKVPMIDLFNCLVESQKIPIFSVAGEPFNELLARIGFQANADVVVFGGMGLIFDDYHFFRTAFEDHGQIMNTMIRFYSGAVEAQKKQAMAFELSPFDDKLLKFGRLFRERFMDIRASLPVIEALDLCWLTLSECFEPKELLMKQNLIDKYYPKPVLSGVEGPAPGVDEEQEAVDKVA
jgi:vacuolar-type H+-ATPase subunit B/Vma2